MEGFSYNNIFDTKGAEYLVVIAFLLVLILWWRIMNNKYIKAKKTRKTPGVLSYNTLKVPQGLIYSKNHTWVFMERSGIAKMGLNDLLVQLTRSTLCTPIKKPGDQVRKGEVVAELVQKGKGLRIISPISGTVVQPNPVLAEDQDALIEDPYGNGWLYSIRPTNWKQETACCYQSGESSAWLGKELERCKEFLSINMNRYVNIGSPVILQDGGELYDHALAALPEECWKDFQEKFCTL